MTNVSCVYILKHMLRIQSWFNWFQRLPRFQSNMSSPQKWQKSLPAACFASQGPPPRPASHVHRKDPKNAGLVHNVPGWKWMKNCEWKWCWSTQLSVFFFFCVSFCQLVTFCSNRGISVHEFPTVTVLELGGSQQNSAITKSQQLWTTSHPFN